MSEHTIDRRKGEKGMTNEDLYNLVLEPRLQTMELAIKALAEVNGSEHAHFCANLDKVIQRLFMSNGRPALTVQVDNAEKNIAKLMKVSHEPTMGRRRVVQDGAKIGGGSVIGAAIYGAIQAFILHLKSGGAQ